MALVYVLKSEKFDRKYIGSTRNNEISIRLYNHNSGRVRSTKAYKPWKVIYVENYETYKEARKRELFLKTGIGRKELGIILSKE